MITQQDYFNQLLNDKQKSYEALVFVQLARIEFICSQDDSTSGKITVMMPDGTHSQMIKEDMKVAYINSVRGLYMLMAVKMSIREKKKIKLPMETKQDADNNMAVLFNHIHKTGIFGRRTIGIVVDWNKKWLKQSQ